MQFEAMIIAQDPFIDVHDAVEKIGRKLFAAEWHPDTNKFLRIQHNFSRFGTINDRRVRHRRVVVPQLIQDQLAQVYIELRHLIAYGNLRAYYLGPKGDGDWRSFDPAIARSNDFRMDLATKFISNEEGALEFAFCIDHGDLNRVLQQRTRGRPPEIDYEILRADADDYFSMHSSFLQKDLIDWLLEKHLARHHGTDEKISHSSVKNFAREYMEEKGVRRAKRQ